jgi:hypothetical protein
LGVGGEGTLAIGRLGGSVGIIGGSLRGSKGAQPWDRWAPEHPLPPLPRTHLQVLGVGGEVEGVKAGRPSSSVGVREGEGRGSTYSCGASAHPMEDWCVHRVRPSPSTPRELPLTPGISRPCVPHTAN